jgi:hypothetical protein
LVKREIVRLVLGAVDHVLAAPHSPADREVKYAAAFRISSREYLAYCRSDFVGSVAACW